MDLIESPLHSAHVEAGAKFAEFGGWTMPLEYAGGGVLAEHAAVRERVGLFDVSHLGKASILGPGAAALANRCLSADLDKIGPGQAQYTLLCADDGGVVDDLIAYRMSDEHIFLIPNAANCAEVVRRIAEAAPPGVDVVDRHRDFAVLALQGPEAAGVLRALGLPVDHPYMSFERAELGGAGHPATLTVCRTGYTGERGYELVTESASAPSVWAALVAAGAEVGLRPAGLGARDTLRTEMGYPLHGHDISPRITPVQARLGWAVGWGKPEFFGAEALRAERAAGPARMLRGLRALGRGIPRPGMSVLDEAGGACGEVTSGTFSPTLRTGIALALLDARVGLGDSVQVAVRGRTEPFEVVRPPFVSADAKG